MSEFLQSAAHLVGRQVKLVREHTLHGWEGMSSSVVAMLEDVDLGEQTIKLEGHSPLPMIDVYKLELVNPDFTKRRDR